MKEKEAAVVLEFQIEGKVLGKKSSSLGTWDVQLQVEGDQPTLRCKLSDFIDQVVRDEVKAFQKRQQKRRLNRIMAPEEISTGAEKGKIDPGDRNLNQQVDADQAVQTALEAFKDGLYYVFIDREQIQDLDSEVLVHPGSLVTFIRLVALAGG